MWKLKTCLHDHHEFSINLLHISWCMHVSLYLFQKKKNLCKYLCHSRTCLSLRACVTVFFWEKNVSLLPPNISIYIYLHDAHIIRLLQIACCTHVLLDLFLKKRYVWKRYLSQAHLTATRTPPKDGIIALRSATNGEMSDC